MTKKEVFFAEADNSDYIHGETSAGNPLYETAFEHENHMSTIFTEKRFKGKVKITIEEV